MLNVPNSPQNKIKEKISEIMEEIAILEDGLASYEHVDNPHWGHVGTLHHILEQLQQINGKE